MKGWMGKFRVLFILGSTALVLSGCGLENLTALDPKGYGAQVSLDLIILSIVIMVFVFLVVMVIYTFVFFRFRQKKGQEDVIPKQVEGNKVLEVIWTVIPIILLLILAVPTVTATFDLAEGQPEGSDLLNVNVTGNQYWWNFSYDDLDVQTSQDLYIPTGERVYIDMKSSDVIHSFWLPSISGKMDVNPENENTMFIEAQEEGVYWGKCAELCGPSHSLMDFRVVAVSPDEFDQWVTDMKNVDPEAEPETASAQEGKQLFSDKGCISCHALGSSPTAIGPNLTSFGSRTKFAGILDPTKENLVDWIMDPESIKPGNKMTGNYKEVTEEEASKIADYLLQLEPSEITPEDAESE
ncbi:cytochrome c oxidase subunit II [Aquibacillus sp. 3ASR75-11]|uniref:Cytochrome c oxidase subunit 2 n=1 Tax=Terrihalobacillus insolitus TaxID=2950438 RepID=A0A9X3WT25_9BACI|nr:cytochrome c oxidase subunit II [Terrihalobacillus insolitus]MDC3412797.1 cytochrome c oxidase subunit II [Terrihalobacillus insolitus]MDC3423726.1 cytochrome c oxidase subunit II [Terrihalobacillus insolitus]